MSTIYSQNGEQVYSNEAIAELKGQRYAVVQSSEGNKMAVMVVDENGFCEWDYFGGRGRTDKAIAEAKTWVKK